MPNYQAKFHRKSIRLPDYDYTSEGAYFITIVTHQRECLFGNVIDDEVELNTLGCIADEYWRAIPLHFDNTILGEYIVMPNHVHGIIFIYDVANVRAQHAAPLHPGGVTPNNVLAKSLGAIVRSYKSAVTRGINKTMNTPSTKRWLRNYYDRIIRNDRELNAIRQYIQTNPARWSEDEHYLLK